jgi:hypothetical protein
VRRTEAGEDDIEAEATSGLPRDRARPDPELLIKVEVERNEGAGRSESRSGACIRDITENLLRRRNGWYAAKPNVYSCRAAKAGQAIPDVPCQLGGAKSSTGMDHSARGKNSPESSGVTYKSYAERRFSRYREERLSDSDGTVTPLRSASRRWDGIRYLRRPPGNGSRDGTLRGGFQDSSFLHESGRKQGTTKPNPNYGDGPRTKNLQEQLWFCQGMFGLRALWVIRASPFPCRVDLRTCLSSVPAAPRAAELHE